MTNDTSLEVTSQPSQQVAKKKPPLSKEKKLQMIKEETGWFAFILPVVLGILIFSLVPMVLSLYYSFFDAYNGDMMFPAFFGGRRGDKLLFGFKNYQTIFDFSISADLEIFAGQKMIKSLGFTFLYGIISVPLNLLLSFGLALLVNSKIKGVGVFRALYYLPCLIPSVISGALFRDFFKQNEQGLMNNVLTQMGLPMCEFFNGADTALPTMLTMNVIMMGGGMILWLSALKNVPESLIEAAKLDGAGYFRRLITVVIPMCTSILFYNIVTGVIGAMQMMGQIKALAGGNSSAEKNLPFYAIEIYNRGIRSTNGTVGIACALAWVLFVVIGILTVFIFKSSNWVYYGDGGDK